MLLGFNSAGTRQESEHSTFHCYRNTLLNLKEKGVDSDFLYESCRRQWVSGYAKDFNKERTDKDVQEMLRMIDKKENSVCTLKDENIIPYLPYLVKVQWIREDDNAKIISDLTISDYNFLIRTKKAKPILRPLSDLTKEIEHNGEKFVPMVEYSSLRFEEISNYKGGQNVLNFIQVREYKLLLEMHFDVFGLIDKGLAIDISTLNDLP